MAISLSRVNDIGVDIVLALHFDKYIVRIVAKAQGIFSHILEALMLLVTME